MLHGVNENEFRVQRLANMAKLAELGYKPFGQAFERTGRLKELRDSFQEGRTVTLAGRLVTRREMGKSIFADLVDGSGRLQIYAKKNDMGEQAFLAFQHLDIGDHIGVEGEMFTTKMGEPTIKIVKWVMLSKALLPLPEKFHGLQDVDTRFRQRYLDLIANPDVREVFNKRIDIIREMRAYLVDRGFYEVETPMIQPMAGGA
ncbi:MAG TPA: OB-fold nucleic acid binding domain-containing protein, partial [Kiritimatiellia bacterium]